MEIKELNGNGKIVVARKEIYVPHLDGVFASSLPMVGPASFKNVMSAIDEDKGLRPTTAQTFSLVDLALQNPEEEHCKDILSKFKNKWFWTATESLWGNEDVIVYDNVDGKMPFDRKSLIKRYEDGDEAVRIVPYGFKTESQSIAKFIKNPYVIAQVGNKNMIDVVKRVTKRISNIDPYVSALGSTNEDVKRYTVLDSGWCGDILSLVASRDGSDYNGYAFRVCNASKAA